jgi:hypothetical protein
MALTQVIGKGLGTLGDGTANDVKIVFDGNAQDFHIGLDDSADSLTIGLGSALGTTSHMVIDANGHITKPLQPAFSVAKSGHQSNYGTGIIAVTFDTERFDQNGDFSSNTFTAPVTGRYQLSYNIYMDGLTDDAAYYGSNLVTSNRKYYFIFDPDFGQDAGYWNMNMSLLVEMDAGDTASVELEVHASASGNNDLNGVTTFHGFLAC